MKEEKNKTKILTLLKLVRFNEFKCLFMAHYDYQLHAYIKNLFQYNFSPTNCATSTKCFQYH